MADAARIDPRGHSGDDPGGGQETSVRVGGGLERTRWEKIRASWKTTHGFTFNCHGIALPAVKLTPLDLGRIASCRLSPPPSETQQGDGSNAKEGESRRLGN